jgi:hypothetical protein
VPERWQSFGCWKLGVEGETHRSTTETRGDGERAAFMVRNSRQAANVGANSAALCATVHDRALAGCRYSAGAEAVRLCCSLNARYSCTNCCSWHSRCIFRSRPRSWSKPYDHTAVLCLANPAYMILKKTTACLSLMPRIVTTSICPEMWSSVYSKTTRTWCCHQATQQIILTYFRPWGSIL